MRQGISPWVTECGGLDFESKSNAQAVAAWKGNIQVRQLKNQEETISTS